MPRWKSFESLEHETTQPVGRMVATNDAESLADETGGKSGPPMAKRGPPMPKRRPPMAKSGPPMDERRSTMSEHGPPVGERRPPVVARSRRGLLLHDFHDLKIRQILPAIPARVHVQ